MGFPPIYSVLLKNICGNSYRQTFIVNLIRLNIIECDGKYSKIKHESFGFRITKRYRGQPIKIRTINDTSIRNSIVRNRVNRLLELQQRIRPIAHVARWSIDRKLEINKKEAYAYLELYRKRMFKEIRKRNLLPKYRDEEEAFTYSRYYRAMNQVESWGISPRLTVDQAGGRLYTPVTSLMSPLRHFLTYDGEQLVSFDLKNSQPLHYLLFLKPAFWKKGAAGLSLEKLDIDLYERLSESTSPFIMFHRIAETIDNNASKNPTFQFLVQKGKLYEFISKRFYDKFQHNGAAVRYNTRNKTKGEFLKLMYFNPRERYSTSHEAFNEFQALFPVEASVMSLLKKHDYKDFSVLLQKIEARILLHHVCMKVFNISPDIPLFTVHDSIITTEQYADLLEQVLQRTYTDLLGFPPPLKREVLNGQQAELERMKYVRNKVDQADIEVVYNELPAAGLFSFLKCENWNIDTILKQSTEKELTSLDNIPGIPQIILPILPY